MDKFYSMELDHVTFDGCKPIWFIFIKSDTNNYICISDFTHRIWNKYDLLIKEINCDE